MLKLKFAQCPHSSQVCLFVFQIQQLNTILVPANVIKLLGESMYINLHDLALGKDFLDVTLKTQETKEKVIN